MLSYVATIQPDGDTFMVSFPDFPGVYSQGDDFEDAMRHGRDALESALYFLVRDGKALPVPSKIRHGHGSSRKHHQRVCKAHRLIAVSPDFAVKLLLIGEMAAQRMSQAELSRRMRVTPQEVTRLLDLRHNTKIGSLAAALNALGKQLEISLAV
jgi:antitoxin HicB